MANMGAAMAPRPVASSRSCWLSPVSFASTRPSANDAIMLPMICGGRHGSVRMSEHQSRQHSLPIWRGI